MKSGSLVLLFSVASMLCFTSSCSPTYIARAGWEEFKILRRRQPLDEAIAHSENSDISAKLQLVKKVRSFAKEQGLTPGGSFNSYSKVDRDVLVWVLSAAEKLSFTPLTWWFPIVGRVPYKGFFEKDDGLEAALALKDKGYDILLRPSAAFSTLGWFNDPMLSTYINFDDVDLTNTVIHELLHNTLWVKNHAEFNETLANFVGLQGAALYFDSIDINKKEAALAECNINKSLIYSKMLAELKAELDVVYQNKKLNNEDKLAQRETIFSNFIDRQEKIQTPGCERKRESTGGKAKINNALILAHIVYHDRLWLFNDYFEKNSRRNLKVFISQMKELADKANSSGKDPYELLQNQS
ncbi:MAG: aminopeptidase [bacterium]|nr:aminopeptidase [bacterium]